MVLLISDDIIRLYVLYFSLCRKA